MLSVQIKKCFFFVNMSRVKQCWQGTRVRTIRSKAQIHNSIFSLAFKYNIALKTSLTESKSTVYLVRNKL